MGDKTQALNQQGAKVGLQINASKTKMMRIYTTRSNSIFIEGEQVGEVDDFTYLGIIVSKKGGSDKDIQARIEKARQAFVILRPIELGMDWPHIEETRWTHNQEGVQVEPTGEERHIPAHLEAAHVAETEAHCSK